MYAPNSNGIIGDVARAVSPQVAYNIGQYFKQNKTLNQLDNGNRPEEQSPQHLLAHTILGAAVSYATGNNPTIGALSAVGSEAVAPVLSNYLYGKKPNELSQDEKDTITSILSLTTAITTYTTTGGSVADAVNGAEIGRVGVEWNAGHSAKQIASISKRQQNECKSLGIPSNQCGKYHGEKSLEILRQIGLFIIPTTPEEIAIAVVTGGAGGYVIKAGGKILSKTFKSKDEAEKVLAEAKRVRYNNPQTYREDLARQAGIPRDIINNPTSIWGKAADQIKQSLEMDGAVVTKKPHRARSSGNGQVYEVKGGSSGIGEFEYHAGGGVHGAPYYKIVKNDGTIVKIIEKNSGYKPGTITRNQIYLNPQGQRLIYKGEKWMIWE
ncbi:Possible hemagglutinin (DUF637) [Moraxella cuniculi]|uniref:Possible hemagglutinin (DUF637) n=1 Tax=Moraxella cuniculi TaxID=34061 RepID=A0A3S4RKR1_9GAMM|nr:Possible hemagglutinin (DUF637) [Moraxella cuniculi]